MGLFSNMFKSSQDDSISIANDKEAFFAIIFAAISADGEVDDEEIDALSLYLTHSNYMSGVDGVALYRKFALIRNSAGIGPIVSAAVKKVAPEMKPTLFAVTVDFVLADGLVTAKEEELLEDLQKGLDLDPNLAQKIIEVLVIKNKS